MQQMQDPYGMYSNGHGEEDDYEYGYGNYPRWNLICDVKMKDF